MLNSQIEFADNTCLVKDPLVSVVMITYNHERYLAEAIEGVIRQGTSFPVELLIGEDCSTDGTRNIALSYQKQFPEMIRVITSERNLGMHENFARLLAAARGKYIAFCEGDDYWCTPDKLELQVSVLDGDSNISIVCTDWRVVSDDGTPIKSDVLHLDKCQTHYMGLDDILLSGKVKTLTVCARTELVKQIIQESTLCKIPSKYPCGDHPLWVELSQFGRIRCLPTITAAYRMSVSSATRRSDPMETYRFIAGWAEFDRDAVDLYSLQQGEEATALFRINVTRRRFRALALLGESREARDELKRLRGFGVRIGTKERLMYILSTLVRSGTAGALSLKWGIHMWRVIRYGIGPTGERLKLRRAKSGQ